MSSFRGLRRILLDFKRHPWLHLVSTSTIMVAMVILGAFLICYRNFERLAESTNPNTTGTLYLRDGLSGGQIQTLKDRILSLESVQRVTFKAKDTVLEELSVFLGAPEGGTIPAGELFPDILELEIQKNAPALAVSIVKASLSQFPEIVEADFSEDWLLQYKNIRGLLRTIGIVLVTAIVCGCAFLIANFMGMRHQQRKNEIDIVRLMGANQQFVLSPFLWEGIIEGVLGTVSALAFLVFLRNGITEWGARNWANALGFKDWLFLSGGQIVGFIILGLCMAFLGSIGVFLRFREGTSR